MWVVYVLYEERWSYGIGGNMGKKKTRIIQGH